MWNNKYREELNLRRKQVLEAGGTKKVEKQHDKGKMTARERIEYLFDKDSFTEIGSMAEARNGHKGSEKRIPGDGVITGVGMINGCLTYAASEDFTVQGGTLGETHAKKICRMIDMALQMKAPLVILNDSGGARIEEGSLALHGYGEIFRRHVRASGVIPQIAAIMGPCAGGACYAPAICDYIFMTEKSSYMFITGPGIVKTAIGEKVSERQLGGARVHAERSGVAHFVYEDDASCLDGIRKLISYFPQSDRPKASHSIKQSGDMTASLTDIVPEVQRKVYDIHQAIEVLVDQDSFFEIQADFAENIVVGYARMDQEVIGIVANQPQCMGGVLDIDASEKAARFVRCCDCFHIPILTLVDTPGFLPGSKQETGGIIRRGAKLLYAYAEASVPKVSVVFRKAYGGAYIAMNSKGMGADIVYAWPIAQIGVMGAEMALDLIYRHEIEQAEDKEAVRRKLTKQYNEELVSPYAAASMGQIDEIIFPEETGTKVRAAFFALKEKTLDPLLKQHGNMPL